MKLKQLGYLRVFYFACYALHFVTSESMNTTINCIESTVSSEAGACVQSITFPDPRHKIGQFLAPPDHNGFLLFQPLINFNAKEDSCLTQMSIQVILTATLEERGFETQTRAYLLERESKELQKGPLRIDAKSLYTTCSNFLNTLKIIRPKKCADAKKYESYPKRGNGKIAVNPVADFLLHKKKSNDYPILSLTKNALHIDWGDLSKFGCEKLKDEHAVTASLRFTIKWPGEDHIVIQTTSESNMDLFKQRSLNLDDKPVDIDCNPVVVTITITISNLKFGSTDNQIREPIVFKDREVTIPEPKIEGNIKAELIENYIPSQFDKEEKIYLRLESDSQDNIFKCLQNVITIKYGDNKIDKRNMIGVSKKYIDMDGFASEQCAKSKTDIEVTLKALNNSVVFQKNITLEKKKDTCASIKTWTSWSDSGGCSVNCGGGIKRQQRQCLDYWKTSLDATKCRGDRERIMECNTDNCKCDPSSKLFATILDGNVELPDNKNLFSDEGYLPVQLDFTKLKEDDFENLENVVMGGFSIKPFVNTPFTKCTDFRDDKCFKVTFPMPTRLEVNVIIPVKANFKDGHSCSYEGLKVGMDERLIYKKWTKWSKCSVACGDGTMTRSRDCLLGQEDYCKVIANIREERTCQVGPCPGTYGPWGNWTTCDKDCVSSANVPGKKNRSRPCEGGECQKGGLQEESKDCWGSPEPNFCTPNCSLVALEETKSKTSPTRYDLVVRLTRAPHGTWDSIISQKLLLRDEKYAAAEKIWVLNKTISKETKDHESSENNYQSDEIPFQCSSCTEDEQTCRCTFKQLKLYQEYSLRLIVKEKSQIHNSKSEIVTIDTLCPKQTIILNDWQCKSGNQSITALGVCNGTSECSDSSDEDEMMCKGETKLKYVGVTLLLCLILDVILIALLFQFNQIEKTKLQIGIEQSSPLEELWQNIFKETTKTDGLEIGVLIENLSENEKVKALDMSLALEHTLQERVFKSFASKLGKSELFVLVANKIKNKKKRKTIMDVVEPGCVDRWVVKVLKIFSPSVITTGMFSMALAGGIFSSINSVYDPFKDIGLILVLYFFIEEIIQGNFSRIQNLNLTYVVLILIGCLILSYLVLTWIRIQKLPTNIIKISTGAKICCIIPGFFYVLNAFISISISHELYQAQRRIQKLKGKKKMQEAALITQLKDKIYVIEDNKRAIASAKAVLETVLQCTIVSTLFLRTNLRAIFLSTITKTIPYLFEIMTIISYLSLLLKIRSYKSGCKQSSLSLGGLLQSAAMGMMLIQKVFLYVLVGYQFQLLIVGSLIMMILVIFLGSHIFGPKLFLSIGWTDRFIYAVASSLIPITLPEPTEIEFTEEKNKSKSTNEEEMEMQKPMLSELDKKMNDSSINLKESSKHTTKTSKLETKDETNGQTYKPRSDSGIFIYTVHLIESILLVGGILIQTHFSIKYNKNIFLLFNGNINYVYTIFVAFLFQGFGVIATIIFYRFKHPWGLLERSEEVKDVPQQKDYGKASKYLTETVMSDLKETFEEEDSTQKTENPPTVQIQLADIFKKIKEENK